MYHIHYYDEETNSYEDNPGAIEAYESGVFPGLDAICSKPGLNELWTAYQEANKSNRAPSSVSRAGLPFGGTAKKLPQSGSFLRSSQALLLGGGSNLTRSEEHTSELQSH